jgi:hypothetical protein
MSVGRCCKPFFASTLFQITVFAFAAWCFTCSPASAYTRKIYDGSLEDGNYYWCNHYDATYNYYFGRSEGKPVRGPNPMVGTAYYGSTDVDDLYDLVPVIHSYYATKFGRNGPNGLGGMGDGTDVPSDMYKIFANANVFDEGVAPLTGYAYLGVGGQLVVNCGSAHDADLIGHEVGHVVGNTMQYNPDGTGVRLTHSGESGALDEGLADFYGEAFERYTTGTNDWLFTCGSLGPRDLGNPGSRFGLYDGFPTTAYPDRYLSPRFYTGTDIDHGGMHFNSTVFSHGLYLASEGGSFSGFDITGIGFDMVEQIVYRAETMYFDADETFNMAYADMIQATQDLYGSTEVATITAALQAVEMNQVRAPEPSTIALLAIAAIGLLGYARRKR